MRGWWAWGWAGRGGEVVRWWASVPTITLPSSEAFLPTIRVVHAEVSKGSVATHSSAAASRRPVGMVVPRGASPSRSDPWRRGCC